MEKAVKGFLARVATERNVVLYADEVFMEDILTGEYACRVYVKSGLCLDIGANVGAFTLWASCQWPRVKFVCYEPVGASFKMLQTNIEMNTQIQASLLNCAVTTSDKNMKLYRSTAVGGFLDYGEKIMPTALLGELAVAKINPKDLPVAQVIKIDTEGSELDILSNYPHLDKVNLVLLEIHFEEHIAPIKELLKDFKMIRFQKFELAWQGAWVREKSDNVQLLFEWDRQVVE
jgi:FkbM family methyltransferase